MHAGSPDDTHAVLAGGLEQRVEALAAAARMQAGAAGGAQLARLNGSLDESSLNKASRLLWKACLLKLPATMMLPGRLP